MSKSSQDSQTFSGHNALLRVAMGANILAWAILTLALIDLINVVRQIVQSWPLNLPTGFFDQLGFWTTNVISRYTVDLFYVFVLFGIAQLIYLGLDILFEKEEVAAGELAAEMAPVAGEAD
jgi:hypothetical protein